jgi:hypothetical protein
VLLSALRRLLILFAVIFAVTAAVSLVLGALAHANLERALAVGFYIAGSAVLIGSFVFGLRGPVRGDYGGALEETETGMPRPGLGGFLPRRVRRTTADERLDARQNSIALFALGVVLILIGSAFDPVRHPF